MKVVSISDTHGQHEKLNIPDGDVIIHCGDFSATGSYKDHFRFSKWFGSLPHKFKLCTPGNHDKYSYEQTFACKEMFRENGCLMLIDELIEIEGKRLYFSPHTPTFGRWYWMADRGEPIARKWANIPTDLDILVTHGPPYGILDISVYDKIHVGCEELTKAIYEKKPKKHVFGHIHFYGGRNQEENNTTFYNAAICDEEYKPTNTITEFSI